MVVCCVCCAEVLFASALVGLWQTDGLILHVLNGYGIWAHLRVEEIYFLVSVLFLLLQHLNSSYEKYSQGPLTNIRQNKPTNLLLLFYSSSWFCPVGPGSVLWSCLAVNCLRVLILT